jgi:basic membrane protein A and related proteins
MLAASASACGGQKTATGDAKGAKKPVQVGLAFDIGGRGDRSYDDAAAAGLDRARSRLDIQTRELSAKPDEPDSDKEARLRLLAQRGFNPVIGVGALYTASVIKVAKDFPNTKFLVVDADQCKVAGANVEGACFAEEQGSYLVGAAAALKSRTGTIGFVGGVNIPLIRKFYAGYAAGAKAVKPSIHILAPKYLTQPPDFDGFKNPALGAEAASGELDAGADVIYHAAGGSGIGVIKTTATARKLAIGVDSDQYLQTALGGARNYILTSMVKRVDVAVFDFVVAVVGGRFTAGTKIYNLSNNGVDYATSGGRVDDIKTRLDALKKAIIDGKITVPAA